VNLQAQQGLMRTYRQPWRNRSLTAWLISGGLIAFYCILYWTEWLTPVAQALGLRHKWFLYGGLYSVAMVGGAIWYLRQHGNSRYNQLRIATNVAVQVGLAFALPYVLAVIGQPEYYFSYFWPLSYDKLFPETLQSLPPYLAAYTVIGAFVLAPGASVLFGKRWYCSWVCGCGALANTFGDPWRHLTASDSRSWRFEKYAIHTVLLVALLMTAIVMGGQLLHFKSEAFYQVANATKGWYGFLVGSVLAGVVGTGLYPLLGPRVWCRNFCPMAALLGITQKVGRFRIRVKPDMCISCGNCTTYCEMGIDVRSYAQSNQSFTRASCVGCGMCAHVCPRGVLKLENHWDDAADKRRQGIGVVDF
jgi:ferredoxin-type protein NapH